MPGKKNWIDACASFTVLAVLSGDNTAVVIPCFNEAAAISTLVAEVRKFIPFVIIVDDGSTDATASLAQAAGACVLRHPCSQGKGEALLTGFNKAAQLGFRWALTMDGDGQHSPDDIPVFLNSDADAALVIGNRMGNPTGMPALRRLVNRWMSCRISRLLNIDLPDTQCGFRLVRLGAMNGIRFSTAHFDFESEMLVALVAAGHPVRFVPIRAIYRGEKSKICIGRDTLRWFQWYVRAQRQFRQHTGTGFVTGEDVRSTSLAR